MKIGEAQNIYSNQVNRLRNRKNELQKKLNEETTQTTEEREGVILELSEVNKKYDAAKNFMEDFMNYKTAMLNAENAKKQGEAAEKASQDMGKCMEIARRIAHGDKVPASDEKRLLEFNYEMYMAAKNMAALNINKKHKEYDSLWDDEDEENGKTEKSASEIVDDRECGMIMPSEVSVDSTSVSGE